MLSLDLVKSILCKAKDNKTTNNDFNNFNKDYLLSDINNCFKQSNIFNKNTNNVLRLENKRFSHKCKETNYNINQYCNNNNNNNSYLKYMKKDSNSCNPSFRNNKSKFHDDYKGENLQYLSKNKDSAVKINMNMYMNININNNYNNQINTNNNKNYYNYKFDANNPLEELKLNYNYYPNHDNKFLVNNNSKKLIELNKNNSSQFTIINNNINSVNNSNKTENLTSNNFYINNITTNNKYNNLLTKTKEIFDRKLSNKSSSVNINVNNKSESNKNLLKYNVEANKDNLNSNYFKNIDNNNNNITNYNYDKNKIEKAKKLSDSSINNYSSFISRKESIFNKSNINKNVKCNFDNKLNYSSFNSSISSFNNSIFNSNRIDKLHNYNQNNEFNINSKNSIFVYNDNKYDLRKCTLSNNYSNNLKSPFEKINYDNKIINDRMHKDYNILNGNYYNNNNNDNNFNYSFNEKKNHNSIKDEINYNSYRNKYNKLN